MNIIDHSLAESHETFGDKYGHIPSLLRKFVGAALDKCKETKMADLVRSCTTNVVSMPWRNNVVTMENGVYVMRHMETYFGEKEKDWDCGLSAKGTKGLEMCRIKIARTLLTCAHNTRGSANQNKATKYWRERPAKFNFERWVENYGL
ncbi:uncharacterized protein LOC121771533 [Salvia splendens]|uniref:uncharacterized protein LOC121771533 n=1 Tax=Salvia splendens TaxID=180675 RepID=UPI001C27C1FB|nr:uncharacterized protein LOC121771533 [Salvia splendens]